MPVHFSPAIWLLVAAVLVQLAYAAYYFWPFAARQTPDVEPAPAHEQERGVSIIVAARNALEQLRHLMPILLTQDYPRFEIVLVDDRSDDDTGLYAQQLTQYYPNVRLVTVGRTPEGLAPKKYALTLGIKVARYPYLLFTDADCVPTTNQWVRHMARAFDSGADIVLGYGPYAEAPGFLNRLVRFETLLTGLQYLSFAERGQPYMGVGRNLGYSQATFFATKGFASHIRSLSGDDDLLVQDAVALGKTAAVVTHPAAQTVSEAPAGWGQWWTQKRRHMSAGSRYRTTDRLRIGTFMLANGLFYLATLGALFFSPVDWIPLGIAWLVRTSTVVAAYAGASRRLQDRQSVALLPVLDAAYFLAYFLLTASLVLYRKPSRWK
ncbi:glycosyltransferase [Hymenobacter busanensis]|uniref:glycosyltransferase n=1 Tax=Hymenobacter busanensis TaxID=2607656 RepID=UPI0013671B36|nr:glycosyltransferase [Hymenobacter busanensis]QHJ07458.1 glycosyltransferase [Hymenobacter busanensis]